MFSIELLPAGRGDCIWIEYEDESSPRRVLIDGGLIGTFRDHTRRRIEALPKAKRRFELGRAQSVGESSQVNAPGNVPTP